ncbi:Tex family protein [Flexithrix dorotheae]|uniref:Tex family protein n=1 Tax=Flexithrix dorotheae TaxID=70993 RepID=UPI00036DDAEB|nr:Tex family protein [Flexithrix dorotheae]
MDKNILKVSKELGISDKQVASTIELLDQGATIPFISRYRKEVTGSLDEVAITSIRDRIGQLRDLDKRKETVLKSIEEQGKLTDELKDKIDKTETMSELEDLYLPYKPKRRTKATIAREKGLEPLATKIFDQIEFDLLAEAEKFISDEKEVLSVEDALSGARDIIAEVINENQDARKSIREIFEKQGVLQTKVIPGKEEEGQKYKDYYEWEEPLKSVPSHRLLAMRRGEKELILSFSCTPEDEIAITKLEDQFIHKKNEIGEQIKLAIKDGYKRLMKPSMETEIRLKSKQNADEEAIKVFADNLRQLLLAAPLGQKSVLAIDPGFRTGCKVVCLDRQGKLLEKTTIFPNEPQKKVFEAGEIIKNLCQKHKIEAIAIGNGTASRETESFVKNLKLPSSIIVVMVNESGASVYSASEVAREEFPNEDVTVRGSVSIGRRLMDPLAELVKIDPKSIGVGQYQHDVDQNALKSGLDDVVLSCVNGVGVEVNTASKELLTYVSGLNKSIAKQIVLYREENGPFKRRDDLKKVPRLGEKAFEQAAGFLRIKNAENPLDSSAVHPESYSIVEKMAKDNGCTVNDLMTKAELRALIDLKQYQTETIGLPTLKDIINELAKPGRDPREKFESFQFAEGIENMSDLQVGMELPGIVTNITNFGCFVDIGVHQDGLVHLSQLADRFIKHPSEVVKVHQKVKVKVVEVDIKRKRIALTMKSDQKPGNSKRKTEKKSEISLEEKLNMLKSKFK